jgi:hypothetical protein
MSIVGRMSIFLGVVPLGMGIVYAIWPNEQRLAVMRPLSLATIFAALSGTTLGLLNVLKGIGAGQAVEWSRISPSLAESLVPMLFGFSCLAATWICVAMGLWRRP